MTIRHQLRWGGLFICVAAILKSGMNIVVHAGYHTALIQAVNGLCFTGLVLAGVVLYVAQARRTGWAGRLAYFVSGLGLIYANVATFLSLAELAGHPEVHAALVAVWETLPIVRLAVYGVFLGLTLTGLTAAQAGVFSSWAGIAVALGVTLQLPAQFARGIAGPLFFIFTIGGSALFGAGLAWMGWQLWSGSAAGQPAAGQPLAEADRRWGGPLVIIAGGLFSLNALLNNLGELSLIDGISHLLMYTSLVFASPVWHIAQAHQAGRLGLAGFLLTHLGATLSIIPACLIMAQLAGAVPDNAALMVAWVDLPVGRAGDYMTLAGLFLLGLGTLRAGVFPRWTGWLVLAGLAVILPTYFVTQPYLFLVFWAIGATLTGAALACIGWRVLRPA